jgi:hypothetical protein
MSTPFPPPDPSIDVPTAPPSEPSPRRARRGRTALAATAGAAAMAGLLGVVPALVSASSTTDSEPAPTTSPAPPSEPQTEGTAPDAPAETPPESPSDDVIVCEGFFDITIHDGTGDGTGDAPDLDAETFGDCGPFGIEGFPFDDEAFAEFEACIGEFTDVFEGDVFAGELPDFDPTGSVTVFGADGPMTYDLGEGDGEITISRSSGELTVTTEGDVAEIEFPVIEALPLDSAELEACHDLLPMLPADLEFDAEASEQADDE